MAKREGQPKAAKAGRATRSTARKTAKSTQTAARTAPRKTATRRRGGSDGSTIPALLFAQVMHDACTPPGVFNLVNGTGEVVGNAMSGHPDVDMVSFTGSTRAGVLVAQNAAATIKRVVQELGGKSPNVFLPDADFGAAVPKGVLGAMLPNARLRLADFIASVVAGWDTKQVTEKIELRVGRDLQYVRMNGTLVGFLAGGALFALLTAVFGRVAF